MLTVLRPALPLFALFTLIIGVAYPLVVTGIAKTLFTSAASGSLVEKDGKPVGSVLIGQNFTGAQYFWGRPSSTGPYPNNAAASGGSNLGPLNPALAEAVKTRVAVLKQADLSNPKPVPVDLVTASASGLDPHISPAAAAYQVERVARARNLPPKQVRDLVAWHTEGRQLGLFGEPRINVLVLNLALDSAH